VDDTEWRRIEDANVKIYSESDDYQCKHGECDI